VCEENLFDVLPLVKLLVVAENFFGELSMLIGVLPGVLFGLRLCDLPLMRSAYLLRMRPKGLLRERTGDCCGLCA